MKNSQFNRYIFDEVVRFFTILTLMLFAIFLIRVQSDLSRDIILLTVGIIAGKYLNLAIVKT